MTEIVPAILTNDINDFRKKYADLFALSHHFKKMHVDFADGEFVKNETILPGQMPFVRYSAMIMMAHLMTFKPQKYFWDLKKHGFKWILFHAEAIETEEEMLHVIDHGKSMGMKMGLVINPETPLHKIGKYITKVDLIQVMGIHPGFQGQTFMPSTIDKIRELRSLSKHVIISLDGGVKVGIAKQAVEAGVNQLVAGSSITEAPDYLAAIEALQADIKK